MPFQAWIHREWLGDNHNEQPLQWGHALSGMDTSVADRGLRHNLKLQWGHALSGMDTVSKHARKDRTV